MVAQLMAPVTVPLAAQVADDFASRQGNKAS